MARSKVHNKPAREVYKCKVFRSPCPLKGNQLPSVSDVIRHYQHVQHQLNPEMRGADPSFTEVADIVCRDIQDIWHKASIPVEAMKHSKRRLKKVLMEYDRVKKALTRKGTEKHSALTRRDMFRRKSDATLFDVCLCKCEDSNKCTCNAAIKVPEIETDFLRDQRNGRMMYIGHVDKETTETLMKRQQRQEKKMKRLLKAQEAAAGSSATVSTLVALSSSDSEGKAGTGNSTDTDSEFSAPATKVEVKRDIAQMRLPLPAVALICARTGISPKNAAMIVSAGFKDAKIVTAENTDMVVDRSKIRRQVSQSRKLLSKEHADSIQSEPVKALFFDGRKDKTLKIERIGNKRHLRTVVEEHIVLVQEPGNKYLGHVTPSGGSAAAIHDAIINHCKEKEISLDELAAVGADGTAVNTGHVGGVIRQLEETLDRNLQWLICMLHLNELPFRHLFLALDGATSGPNEFSGPIGQKLNVCETLPVVKFRSIPFSAPNVDLEELSTDQKYLLRISAAIAAGECPDELAQMKPGRVAHSRWLTTAARVLRLYVSTKSPSGSLRTLANYIMRVYVPTWFAVKTKPKCIDGSMHLYQLIHRSRYLPKKLQKIVDPVIQKNGYFGHPENILLGMLFDERITVRERAVEVIKKARQEQPTAIRRFIVPPLQFGAGDYTELVAWTSKKTVLVTEPPLTRHLTDNQLNDVASGSLSLALKDIPCHSQAVERYVKTVTEAAETVCGEQARHESILGKIKSRKQMPKFDTKKDFGEA